MSRPVETPFPDPGTLLNGATFGDRFTLSLPRHDLDAIETSRRVFGRTPGWIKALLTARNIMVMPLGLKSAAPEGPSHHGQIGIFPVVTQSPDRVVLGFDDKHLDFRVSLDIAPGQNGQRDISVATAVKTHNALGRTYLAMVKPFHRVIVPAMLKQADTQAA